MGTGLIPPPRRAMHLFFDLDGTLTDSATGIVRCINHAMAALGRPPAPEERLRGMIGTHLSSIFGTVLESSDTRLLDAAIGAYRTRFNEVGIFENELFPGIAEALDRLSRAGHTMQVVTVKPAVAARRVLAHFDIDRFFAGVHAPDLVDRTCDKAALVAAALETAGGRGTRAAMIGDRAEDIHAARTHDVRAVAVGWGYGSREELLAAGPDCYADTIARLLDWVQTAAGDTAPGTSSPPA